MKMFNKALKTPLILAASAVLTIGLSATSVANAADNPFSMTALSSGYMMLASADGKCGGEKTGEAKCGGEKTGEAKCGGDKGGEAKCGADKKGDGKCGADKKGDGKCGADKKGDKSEGKCGEGKCGGNE